MPLVKFFEVKIFEGLYIAVGILTQVMFSTSMLLFHNGNRTEPSLIQSVIILIIIMATVAP